MLQSNLNFNTNHCQTACNDDLCGYQLNCCQNDSNHKRIELYRLYIKIHINRFSLTLSLKPLLDLRSTVIIRYDKTSGTKTAESNYFSVFT